MYVGKSFHAMMSTEFLINKTLKELKNNRVGESILSNISDILLCSVFTCIAVGDRIF